MKRYNSFILLLLLLSLAACSQESISQDSNLHPLELEVGFDHIATRTTVIPGTTFTHESKIKVGIFNSDGVNTVLNQQATYIYKNPIGATGSWVPLNTDKLSVIDVDMDVLAHYPATITADWTAKTITPNLPNEMGFGNLLEDYNSSDSYLVEFQTGKTTEVLLAPNEVDYLTGEGINGPYNKNKLKVQIKMRHALSMVVFHIFKSAENTAPGNMKSITVDNLDNTSGPLRKGSMALKANRFTPAADAMSYKRTMSNAPDGCYYGMMVYPATIAADQVRVTIEIDNFLYTVNVPATHSWEAGKVILYNIKVNPTGAELLDLINVSDWPSLKPDNDHNFEIS